jgi:proteic killer suppression protein
MLLDFDDQELRRLYTDPGYQGGGVAAEVIRAFRKVLNLVTDAVDERDLYGVKSLHFEKLKGKRAGQSAVRLNKQWRLIVRLVDTEAGRVVLVMEIADYH